MGGGRCTLCDAGHRSVAMACPALNSLGEPCRFPMRNGGPCPYHRDSILRSVERQLPNLRREPLNIATLERWAAEFDRLDRRRRYTAAEFVSWLELEAAPPAPPLRDDPGPPVYSVVGAGALALRAEQAVGAHRRSGAPIAKEDSA